MTFLPKFSLTKYGKSNNCTIYGFSKIKLKLFLHNFVIGTMAIDFGLNFGCLCRSVHVNSSVTFFEKSPGINNVLCSEIIHGSQEWRTISLLEDFIKTC